MAASGNDATMSTDAVKNHVPGPCPATNQPSVVNNYLHISIDFQSMGGLQGFQEGVRNFLGITGSTAEPNAEAAARAAPGSSGGPNSNEFWAAVLCQSTGGTLSANPATTAPQDNSAYKKGPDDGQCPVCYDRQCNCILPCGHLFCGPCIGTIKESNRNSTCPLCKAVFYDYNPVFYDYNPLEG